MTLEKSKIGEANDEDLRLIQRFREGHEQAFAALVTRHQQRVFDLIFRCLGRKDEVEDLAQEIFMRVYASLPRFEARAAFRTWLYRIVLNVCIDHRRRRKLRRMLSLQSLSDWTLGRLWSRQDKTAVTEAASETEELQRQIQNGLNALPEEFRIALVLRDVDELEYEEIAQTTGVNLGTVKSRLFRARLRMREHLQPYMEDEQ